MYFDSLVFISYVYIFLDLTTLISQYLAYISLQNWSIFLTVGRAFLFPIDISPYPVLPAIVSQMFPPRDNLYICGCQDFVSAP
jgi:hypothetical protein